MTGRRWVRRTLVTLPVAGVVAALGAFGRVKVQGDSMRPTLEPGDRLLVLRLGHRRSIRRGSLVTVVDPRPDADGRLLVKRIADLGPTSVVVRGDSTEKSTDSRSFGRVPRSSITGLVLYRYGPAHRTGVVR